MTRCTLARHDQNSLLTRSMTDSAIALWDLRKYTKPVWRVDDLECTYATTACGFAPPLVPVGDEKTDASKEGAAAVNKVKPYGAINAVAVKARVAVEEEKGTAVNVAYAAFGARGAQQQGGVAMFDSVDGRRIATLPLDAGQSALDVRWSAALRQLAVGQSDGTVRVFYRPDV
jgi:hypothetical protein